MPDKVRSVDDMVADMEKAVEEPEGNTSSGKHRQHVAQAIEKLISSQIIDGKSVGANSRTRPVRETKRSRLHSMNTPRLSKVHVRTAAPSLPNLFALEWIVSTTIVATSRVTWLLVALHVTT